MGVAPTPLCENMVSKKAALFFGTVLALGLGTVLVKRAASPSLPTERTASAPEADKDATQQIPVMATSSQAEGAPSRSKVKWRLSDFSEDQKSAFQAKFEDSYKPAVLKWAKAYHNRVPFAPMDLTLDDFRERIGRDVSYNEYIFVVDGVTLGIRDSKEGIRVDYLNVGQQTRQMASLPDGSQAPETKIPLTKREILALLKEDSGTSFIEQEIRLTPTGLSGALNGGVMVQVGGDPNNIASWKYNMVFGPDGKLVYYLKGIE